MRERNYIKNEKIRYAFKVTDKMRDGDLAIVGYEGNNVIKILIRRIIKFIKRCYVLSDDKLYMANLAVVTSFKCNLNCNGCGQHTPQIKKMFPDGLNVDIKQVLLDLDKITAVVDGIGGIAVANGEGFLNDNIIPLMEYYGNSSKILNLNIPTNGTVAPSVNVLKKMREVGATATITRYSCVPEEKRETVRRLFREYSVRATTYEDMTWFLHEYVDDVICNEKEAKNKYKHCERYFILLNGVLYKCVTNATGIMVGLRPERTGDGIIVKDASLEELRSFIIEKNNISYLESCRHCRGCTGSNVKIIPAGEQILE